MLRVASFAALEIVLGLRALYKSLGLICDWMDLSLLIQTNGELLLFCALLVTPRATPCLLLTIGHLFLLDEIKLFC